MPKSNFKLRDISVEVLDSLKREAKKLHTSINLLVLKMIERGLGVCNKKPLYHDLDHLAGSWSAAEAKVFKENTHFFEIIEQDLEDRLRQRRYDVHDRKGKKYPANSAGL